MTEISRSERLAYLLPSRQAATGKFLSKFPKDVLDKVSDYRSLKMKENAYRRFLKAREFGTLKQDIEENAGFAYEQTEALSDQELARISSLEKSRALMKYLREEASFRRALFKQEQKALEKRAKKA